MLPSTRNDDIIIIMCEMYPEYPFVYVILSFPNSRFAVGVNYYTVCMVSFPIFLSVLSHDTYKTNLRCDEWIDGKKLESEQSVT